MKTRTFKFTGEAHQCLCISKNFEMKNCQNIGPKPTHGPHEITSKTKIAYRFKAESYW